MMAAEPKPPYIDWTLDRWKIGLVLVIFVGLIVASFGELEGAIGAPAEQNAEGDGGAPTSAAAGSPTSAPQAAAPDSTQDAPSGASADSASGTVPAADAQGPASAGASGETPPSTGGEQAAADTEGLPLTMANLGPNASVPPNSVRLLFGTASPQALIEVHDQFLPAAANSDLTQGGTQERVLGRATADQRGLWQLGPFEPLASGQHVLTVRELDAQGQAVQMSEPVVIDILQSGEKGPLSLATPTIRYPTIGAQIGPGAVTFLGSGLPGVSVRLYLDNRLAAEGVVSTREEWRLVSEQELTPGTYVARAVALNPQGEVIAESAPVAFQVVERPAQSSTPLPLSTPSLPLTVSGLAFGDRRRQTLAVRGLASPHAVISIWLDGQPQKLVNARLDGTWQTWLRDGDGFSESPQVEVRTNYGERMAAGAGLRVASGEAAASAGGKAALLPQVLSPKPGEVLTTQRPLIVGVAPPERPVQVIVNDQVVARVRSDRSGLWAYQLAEPLPEGASALRVQPGEPSGEEAEPPTGAAVLITVAPKL